MAGTANGRSSSVNDAARQSNVPEFTVVDVLDRLSQRVIGPILRSCLTDTPELARGVHHAPAFDNVMADGFFDVDILARLHGPDRGECVPMIRCGDKNRGHTLIVEHGTQIL